MRSTVQIGAQEKFFYGDVLAAGVTANEAAKILKKAGAGKVYIFTLGRVVVGKGLDR